MDCDIDQFIESIKRVRDLKFEAAVTSHKGIVHECKALKKELTDYLNKIFEREEKLLGFLKQERNMDEIVDRAIVYGRFPEPKVVFKLFERTMIEKHLERLVRKKSVVHSDKGFKSICRPNNWC